MCGERSHLKLAQSVEEWIAVLYGFKKVSLLINDGDHLCKIQNRTNFEEEFYTSIFSIIIARRHVEVSEVLRVDGASN